MDADFTKRVEPHMVLQWIYTLEIAEGLAM